MLCTFFIVISSSFFFFSSAHLMLLTKTSVQMVSLSDYFASKLSILDSRLPKFHYVKTFYGEIRNGSDIEYVTIEEKLEGDFSKYLNNDGVCIEDTPDLVDQAYCLAHFSFETSEEKLLLTDIQGCGMKLTDPEIASSDFHVNKKALFCIGNICRKAIKNFGCTHECNRFCTIAGLTPLDLKKFEEYDDAIILPDGTRVEV